MTGGEENYILVTLASLTIVYIIDASRVSSRDYFTANYHRALAARARNLQLAEEIREPQANRERIGKTN